MYPVLKGADYTMTKILYETFPTESQQIFPLLRDSFAGGMGKLTLTTVQDYSKARVRRTRCAPRRGDARHPPRRRDRSCRRDPHRAERAPWPARGPARHPRLQNDRFAPT